MEKYLKKGIIQISLPISITILGLTSACIATFYNFIGNDRERISTLEEAVATIKTDTSEIKTDIKSILKNQSFNGETTKTCEK